MHLNELLPENIHIQLFQYGSAQFEKNGWVHKKKAPCTIIAQAICGEYEIISPRGQGRTGEGGIFLAKGGEELTIIHHAKSSTEKMTAQWLHIDYQITNGLDPVFFLELPVVIKSKQANSFVEILQDIRQLWLSKSNSMENIVGQIKHGYSVLSLLEKFSKSVLPLSNINLNDMRLAKVFQYIQEHLKDDIKPTELAKIANLSLSHFHALFQSHVGQTPMSYIKKMRINQAQKLLVTTNSDIKNIAINLGFKNAYHFSREFKKDLGVPPKEYRINHTY